MASFFSVSISVHHNALCDNFIRQIGDVNTKGKVSSVLLPTDQGKQRRRSSTAGTSLFKIASGKLVQLRNLQLDLSVNFGDTSSHEHCHFRGKQ